MTTENLINYWKKELKEATILNINSFLLSRGDLEQLLTELDKLNHIIKLERRKHENEY